MSMRMFFLVLILALPKLTISQTTAPQTFKDAIAYNDYIITEQTKIGDGIQEYIRFTNDTVSTYEEALKLVAKIAAQAKESEEKVKSLPAWKGNTAFRDAAAELFHFYYECLSKDYVEMTELIYKGDNTTETSDKMQDILTKVTESEKVVDEKFQAAQHQFASENGFTLDGDEK